MTKTTFEMDSLISQEDIDNRYYVMTPCLDCKEWTKQDLRQKEALKGNWGQCSGCGSRQYDPRKTMSIRSWEATKGTKR